MAYHRYEKPGQPFDNTVEMELGAAGTVTTVLVSNPDPDGIPQLRFADITLTGTTPVLVIAGRDSAGILYTVLKRSGAAQTATDGLKQFVGPKGCDLVAEFTAGSAGTAIVVTNGEILHKSPSR